MVVVSDVGSSRELCHSCLTKINTQAATNLIQKQQNYMSMAARHILQSTLVEIIFCTDSDDTFIQFNDQSMCKALATWVFTQTFPARSSAD